MNQERPKIHFVRYAQKSKKDARLVSRFSLFLLVFVFAVSLALSAYPIHASAEGEGGVQSALRARIERAEFASLFAGIFDSIGNFFRRFATDRKAEESIVDGQAIREKNRQIAALFTGAETLVDVNAESRFKGSAGFSKDVSVEGLLRGTEIDLGTGRITAGNIIYEVIGGDGILISGDRQRPVVSELFWMRRGNSIVTRDPSMSLEIQGELLVGTPDSSRLTFNGPALVSFLYGATTTIPASTSTAWTIATSATGTPIVSVSANNGGSVGIGTTSSAAKFSIDDSSRAATSSAGINIFEIFGKGGIPFFIVDSEGRVGIATSSPGEFFSVGGNALFAGSTTFTGPILAQATSTFAGTIYGNGSAYFAIDGGRAGVGTKSPSDTFTVAGTIGVSGEAKFGTSPIIPIVSCEGQGVLETDGSGRITCGSDAVGSAGGSGTVSGSDAGNIAYYAGGTKVIGNNSFVFLDGDIRLGIGTSSPATTTSVAGDIYLTGGLGVGRATGTPGVIETTGVINVQGAGTSSFTNGINLSSGCYAVNSNCAVTGSGGGTLNPGTANRLTYYSSATTLDSVNYLIADVTNLFFGIGSTSPSQKLSVSGNTWFDSNYIYIGSSTAASTTILYQNRATSTIPIAVNAFSFATSTSAISLLSLDTANTRVGVGTTAPAATFSVGGDAYLTGGLGVGRATTTSGVIETTVVINVQGAGTSSFTNGTNLAGGCYAIGGTCLTTGVGSVSNSDGTLSISPTTGDVVASLNLANPNNWTALQTFNAGLLATASSTIDRLFSRFATSTEATTTYLAITNSASTSQLTVSNGIFQTGLGWCTNSLDKVRYNSQTGKFSCANEFVSNWQFTAQGGSITPTSTLGVIVNSSSSISRISSILSTSTQATTSYLAVTAHASTSQLTVSTGLGVGRSTTTVGNIETAGIINIQGSGTSSFSNGVNLANGCYSITGSCLVTGVSSVSNSDNTLSISPTTGDVVASLNLANPNTWTGLQTFNAGLLATASSTIDRLFSRFATSTEATPTYLAITNSASTSQLTVSNGIFQTGLGWCTNSLDKVRYNSQTGKFSCANEFVSNWQFTAQGGSITPTSTLGVIVNASSSISRISSILSTSTQATTSYLAVTGHASTSQLTVSTGLGVGRSTTTVGNIETAGIINIQGSGTSSFSNGVNLANGCYSITGSCLVTGVSSVSNSDNTLSISPTTGDVVASLNLANPNTWTALQTFNAGLLATASSTIDRLFSRFATSTEATTTYLAITNSASTSQLTVSNGIFQTGLGVGRSTTTVGNIETAGIINIQGSGTSSFSNGVNLANGCYSITGSCL